MLGHVSFSRFDCIGAGYFALINSIAIDSNFDSIDLIDLIEVDLNFYDGIDGPVLRLGLVGPCAALCGLLFCTFRKSRVYSSWFCVRRS